MEFNPLSEEFFDDPYDTYRWLRDEAPCYHNEEYGFWALSRFDDVVAAHRNWKRFSNEHGLRLDQLKDPSNAVAKQNIIVMDPPEHERMRRLVSRAFTPREITRLEPIAYDVISTYLDALQGERGFDAMADFAAPFPSRSSRRCSESPTQIVSRSATGPIRCSSVGPATRTPLRKALRRSAPEARTSATSSSTSGRIPATT